MRLPSRAKGLLKRAAAARRKTVSAFMLDSGLAAAAETLAERHEFPIGAKQYAAFLAALDAPPRTRPRLAKLLKHRSVLE